LHVEPAPDSSFLERSGLAQLEAAAKPKEKTETEHLRDELDASRKSPSEKLEQVDEKVAASKELDAKLKALQEKTKAEVGKLQADAEKPASLLESRALAWLDQGHAKLQAMKKALIDAHPLLGVDNKLLKVLARMQREMKPSFLQLGTDDETTYNDIQETLKKLEATAKGEMAKIDELPGPSSLLQTGEDPTYTGIHAKLKAMEQKERDELAKIQLDPATPSSMLQNGKYGAPDTATTEMLRVKQKNTEAKLQERQKQWDEQLKDITDLHLGASSFLEEGAPDSFADLDTKLKALEEKTKAELAKLQSDTAAPSSFLEEGRRDIFHDVDAKLKARNNALKEALDELGHPSSFLEEGPAGPISLAETRESEDVDPEQLHALERRYGIPESQSFMQAEAAKMGALETRLNDRSITVIGQPMEVSDGSLQSWNAADKALRGDDWPGPR